MPQRGCSHASENTWSMWLRSGVSWLVWRRWIWTQHTKHHRWRGMPSHHVLRIDRLIRASQNFEAFKHSKTSSRNASRKMSCVWNTSNVFVFPNVFLLWGPRVFRWDLCTKGSDHKFEKSKLGNCKSHQIIISASKSSWRNQFLEFSACCARSNHCRCHKKRRPDTCSLAAFGNAFQKSMLSEGLTSFFLPRIYEHHTSIDIFGFWYCGKPENFCHVHGWIQMPMLLSLDSP